MLRRIKESDIEELIELENATFSSTLGYSMLHDAIYSTFTRAYVECNNNEILGYISLTFDSEVIEIMNFCVKKEYQGQGIGYQLLKNVLNMLKQEGALRSILEVRSKNERAINLYKKLGYKEIHRRIGYYDDDDALLLEKIL